MTLTYYSLNKTPSVFALLGSEYHVDFFKAVLIYVQRIKHCIFVNTFT